MSTGETLFGFGSDILMALVTALTCAPRGEFPSREFMMLSMTWRCSPVRCASGSRWSPELPWTWAGGVSYSIRDPGILVGVTGASEAGRVDGVERVGV